MDKESLVAALSTCNEKVFVLKDQYKLAAAPMTKAAKDTREVLTQYMMSNSLECVKVAEDLYLRLFHRVGSGDTLTPVLFMDVMNSLTPALFTEKVRGIEAARVQRHEQWREEQRIAVRKQLAKALAKKPVKRRPTKRVKHHAMADAAAAMGARASTARVDDILHDAGVVAAAAAAAEAEEEEGHVTRASPDDADAVEAIVNGMPLPVEEVSYTGKGKAYAQRPPPPFHGTLTMRELFVEVLYALIRERHKPVKAVITIDSRPGKSSNIMQGAPLDIQDVVLQLRDVKLTLSKLQLENRSKRKEYTRAMDRCKQRLAPILGVLKYEANMETKTGLRKVTVEVVKSEVAQKRMNMFEMGRILDDVCGGVPERGSVATVLSEVTMSQVIRDVLRKMAEFTEEHTKTIERVRIRRGRARADEEEDEDEDDDNSSVSSFENA
jgi:hypothetical protein